MSRRRLGAGALGLMVVVLLAYALLHSPLRAFVDRPLSGSCTFFCRIPSPFGEMARSASAVWLILAAVAGAWALVTRWLDGSLERLVGGGLAAYGLIVIPAALVAGAGDLAGLGLLQPPVGPLLASIPALVALAWCWRSGWRPGPSLTLTMRRPTPLLALMGLLVVVAFALRIGVAVDHPVTGYDDLGYHGPLAVLLWRDGSLSDFLPRFAGTPVLSHPGGAELWFGLLMLVGGEPLALAGQLPFAVLGAAGICLFARRLGLPSRAGLLAALLYLTAPMVVEQSGHVRNDVVGAALVIATAALLAARREALSPPLVILGGLGLGLMAVTKLALLPAVAALGIWLLVVVLRERRSVARPDGRALLRALAVAVALAAVAVAPWWIRNVIGHGNPLYPGDLPLVGGGIPWQSPPDSTFVPSTVLWPLYPLFERYGDESGLGGAFAVAILPALAGAFLLARRRPIALIILLALVSLPVWWLLDRREPRFLLGLAGLVFALLPFALAVLRRRWRDPAAVVLGLAATLTVGALAATTLSAQAERPSDRLAFYDEVWMADPAAVGLPEDQGILLDDRCGFGFGNRLYPFLGAGRERPLARIDCDGLTTEKVERTLKRDRLAYVYVVLDGNDPALVAAKDALYPADRFQLVETSTRGSRSEDLDIERRLYRWLGAASGSGAG